MATTKKVVQTTAKSTKKTSINCKTRGRKAFAKDSLDSFIKTVDLSSLTMNDAYEAYSLWGQQTNSRIVSLNTFKLMMSGKVAAKSTANDTFIPDSSYINLDRQFARLRQYIDIVASGNYSALYIGGDSGIGKSEAVKQAIMGSADPSKFVVFNGDLKSPRDLAKLLYDNRDGKVVVFDDFDSVLKNKKCSGILKAALNDVRTRYISWVDTTKRAKKDMIPSTFEFTSSVIVISNYTRMDPAIRGRFKACIIQATKADSLDWVRSKFEAFMPGIPMQYKNEVADFISDNINKFRKINFRIVKDITMDRLIDDKTGDSTGTWKQMALKAASL